MIANKYFKDFTEKKSIGALVKLIYFLFVDVVKTGKVREITSFAIWEFMHRAGLFKKSKYLKFKDHAPIMDLEGALLDQYEHEGLSIQKSAIAWKVLYIDIQGNMWGNTLESDHTLFKSSDDGLTKTAIHEFPGAITASYISKKDVIFICSNGIIYRSTDKGASFQKVLEFTHEEGIFRHNCAFTEHPSGALFVGEYVTIWLGDKWHFSAYIYYSLDDGENWNVASFLKDDKVNKHVHMVKYSEVVKGLIMSDGDNTKQLWVNYSADTFDKVSKNGSPGWKKLTKFHLQKGGHTTMVETEGKIFFGTDYMGGTNFILSTSDLNAYEEQIMPDPFRRCWFTNMILRKNHHQGEEIWATVYGGFSSKSKSLLMYSGDSGNTWTRVCAYDGTKYYIDMINSSIHPTDKLYIQIRGTDKTFCISNKSDAAEPLV